MTADSSQTEQQIQPEQKSLVSKKLKKSVSKLSSKQVRNHE